MMIRSYVSCMKQEDNCLTDDMMSNITRYMESLKLKCRGVNGDRDDFKHGCRENEMDICENKLQDWSSQFAAQEAQRDKELFLCTALAWTKLCMIENASCVESVVEVLAQETEYAHGLKCTSATAEPISLLVLLSLLLQAVFHVQSMYSNR